jgi:hypothetical protein
MKKLFLLVLMLAGCAHQVPVTAPPVVPVLTLDQKVNNLLGGLGDCSTIQDHEEGTDIPDCQRAYDAIERGITRATKEFRKPQTCRSRRSSFIFIASGGITIRLDHIRLSMA